MTPFRAGHQPMSKQHHREWASASLNTWNNAPRRSRSYCEDICRESHSQWASILRRGRPHHPHHRLLPERLVGEGESTRSASRIPFDVTEQESPFFSSFSSLSRNLSEHVRSKSSRLWRDDLTTHLSQSVRITNEDQASVLWHVSRQSVKVA